MSEESITQDRLDSPMPEVPSTGGCIASGISWFVILGIVLFLFISVLYSQLAPPDETQGISGAELMNVNLVGRVLIGQSTIDPNSKENLLTQISQFNAGPVEQRYCYAIFVNELKSAGVALEKIKATDDAVKKYGYELSPDQTRLRNIVSQLLETYQSGEFDASVIPQADRDFLTSELGWCGKLALVPPGTPNQNERRAVMASATRALWLMVGVVCLGIGLLLTGLVSIVVILYLLAKGHIQSKMPSRSNRGSIYLETFAIWMFSFILLQLVSGWAADWITDPLINQLLMPAAFFMSLVVLVWPVLRGIPFQDVREDIGWKMGNPLKEAIAGVIAYTALLPVLVCAAVVAVILAALLSLMQQTSEFGGGSSGGHPIQDDIASGDLTTWMIVFFTACIAAPIIEETMFRGVFYRHLKDSTQRWGLYTSIAFAALVNSLIFAAIHPQGIIGIPLLTTLAIGFSLTRQWRSSLVAPMVMHAMNNGLVTCTLFLLMS